MAGGAAPQRTALQILFVLGSLSALGGTRTPQGLASGDGPGAAALQSAVPLSLAVAPAIEVNGLEATGPSTKNRGSLDMENRFDRESGQAHDEQLAAVTPRSFS
jgi:hypothetical protein